MAQIFSRAADTYLRLALIGLAVLLIAALLTAAGFVRSDYFSDMNVAPSQPVPFSHRHHAGELGIDCRYCHTEVETAATAGYPPTHTCMTCHSQIWTNAEALAPVRESLATGTPIRWARVHDLPDFVYFNHAVHVQSGVPCEHCHGPVPEMVRVYQAEPLLMGWCLECHRQPARYLRPRAAVFDFAWHAPDNRERLGERLVAERGIEPTKLDNCYTCHR